MNSAKERSFSLVRGALAVALTAWAVSSLSQEGPRVVSSEYLGPFTGMDAPLHPDNQWPHTVEYWGTDLGFSYAHDGKIHFLFGDTLSAPSEVIEASSGDFRDDAFGWIPVDEWPDPTLMSSDNMPLIYLAQNPGTTEMSAIDPGEIFDSLKTPEAGFSNGTNEFAILLGFKPKGCSTDADCGPELSCDTGLGYLGTPFSEQRGTTLACVDGSPRCKDDTIMRPDEQPVADTGFCVDRTSSVWSENPAGRAAAAAVLQGVAIRSPTDPRRYRFLHRWMTSKFMNATVSAVERFVPGAGSGGARDYRIPDQATEDSAVLVWGRPGFMGVGARGRSLDLYFAYAKMPVAPDFEWRLHYFAGLDEGGNPRYSLAERDAVAVDLDAGQPGHQPSEVHDLIQHMSVSWVGELDKWVMLYGGGIDETPLPALGWSECGLLELFAGPECTDVVPGTRTVRMRTADHPWGPWSAPQDVLEGTDPAEPVGQFGPGGSMYHPDCDQPGCAPNSAVSIVGPKPYGWLYGVNIVEQWTRPAGSGVDLLWLASTWNPYRVVLFRTRIEP